MKIPKEAKCVFKGVIFDVYQWPETMFDGSIATFEMLKRADTVDVIAVKDNLIWYAVQEQPRKSSYESTFGGRVEENETPETGAARELQEEAGLVSNDWELLFSADPLSKLQWSQYLYVARNCGLNGPQQLDAGEKISLKSCTFDEFIEKIIQQKIRVFPQFVYTIMNYVYREPAKLEEFRKKLGL